jgi:hypothetical protein
MNCHPDRSVPGFPATQHWTRPRVRLSVRERYMKFAEATKFHRKSGGAQWRDLLFSSSGNKSRWKRPHPVCHPGRTRISCHAASDTTAFAPFSNERRMKFARATKFNRKSGEAEGSAVLSMIEQCGQWVAQVSPLRPGNYAEEPNHKKGDTPYFPCSLAAAFSASATAFLNAATAGTLCGRSPSLPKYFHAGTLSSGFSFPP